MNRLYIAQPVFAGNEKKYVMDCLDSGWISGSGKYVTRFEEQFAAFCGARHGIGVFNGTVALHVALLGLGVGPGDEVIVPDLTYIASANSVVYCNAKAVFADVDPATWTLDPADVERKITPRTKAIMPVHLYGHPAEMGPLMALAEKFHVRVLEDAAEAHGAEYKGRRVGSIGHVSTFSFFGNKIITSGEGGMVLTDDEDMARHIRQLKGQGQSFDRRYWFPIIGFNYRMTNVQAAIAVAQLERIDWFIERRLEVASWYAEQLADTDILLPGQADWAKNVFWLYAPVLPEDVDRDEIIKQLDQVGIETRPFFYPMHMLPPYHIDQGNAAFPVATGLSARGINLPSHALLTREDVRYISESLKRVISRSARRATKVEHGG